MQGYKCRLHFPLTCPQHSVNCNLNFNFVLTFLLFSKGDVNLESDTFDGTAAITINRNGISTKAGTNSLNSQEARWLLCPKRKKGGLVRVLEWQSAHPIFLITENCATFEAAKGGRTKGAWKVKE